MKLTIELNEYQERHVKAYARKLKNKSIEDAVSTLISMGLSEVEWSGM